MRSPASQDRPTAAALLALIVVACAPLMSMAAQVAEQRAHGSHPHRVIAVDRPAAALFAPPRSPASAVDELRPAPEFAAACPAQALAQTDRSGAVAAVDRSDASIPGGSLYLLHCHLTL